MEELMKALGIKPTKEKSLEEVRTQINDYENFNGSLVEISEAMEINTGTYMILQSIYEDEKDDIENIYRDAFNLSYPFLLRNPEILSRLLIAIFIHAHGKIGEISFMLENDIEALNDREAEILDAMQCREASTHMGDYINEPQ